MSKPPDKPPRDGPSSVRDHAPTMPVTPAVEWEPTKAAPAPMPSSQPRWGGPPSGSFHPGPGFGHDLASGPSAVTSYSGSGSMVQAVQEAPGSMPIAYIVASAVFLAIAVVGFGLWLAFEVF